MTRLGIALAVLLVLATGGVAVYAWQSLSDVPMSAAGYIALIASSVATVGLAGALIALLFYSHAKGFDDDVGGHLTDDEDWRR